ncbi:MAG: GGDEF domain-containing response regulator [Rhodospirillaceae bacterium]|jgi:diguanylate cyclase (GGDEF)-like protein|nr:GGDEF domain-containing response regulator [Rhodospirillaceae bacterium]MBT5566194.1 GGDEF domain-containing response regulator [Rhodospirillaceae bacterium]MBT6088912.1 GGDEF domain-containing response regulator [Rhodospirillaceae bacterium]MBT6961342.1 GGDEF domain-containing response regulator [Rhodospirillaceae bacterium]
MSQPHTSVSESLRILLFEDNAMDASLITRFLQASGIKRDNIVTTDAIPNAMDVLTSKNVDICLTDYYLTPNTGFDLMDEARRRDVDVPFIMLTAMKDPAVDEGALSRGAYDFMIKGELTVENLERTIRYTLARHRRESALSKAAFHDPLSNLSNRKALMDHLHKVIMTPPQTGQAMGAVIYVNLNGIKFINEAYGMKVGDAILRETGRRLKAIKWPGEMMARLGSDEFGCVVDQVDDIGQATVVARRIATAFAQPVRTYDGEHDVSVAIGLSAFSRSSATDDPVTNHDTNLDVLQRAANAMAEAKRTCRMTRTTEIVVAKTH